MRRKIRNWFFCLWNGHQWIKHSWIKNNGRHVCRVCGRSENVEVYEIRDAGRDR